MSELLLALLDEMSQSGPTAFVAEDLHWADAASLVVLARIASSTSTSPIVLVLSLRPRPRREELVALLGSGVPREAVRCRLSPLAEQEWIELVRDLVGATIGPRLRAHVTGAGGSPLFIREVVGGLLAEGLITHETDGTAELNFTGTRPSFSVALFAHLSFLSRPSMELLGVASVLGSGFSLRTLSRLTGRPVAALWSDLAEAVAASVLVEDGDRLAFRHALIHDAFYFDLPTAVRAGLHADAARMLGETHAAGGIVAEHFLRSGPGGSREARAGLHRAAVEVAGTAPAVAVELFESALAMTDERDPVATEINAELALALAASGRHIEAEPLARRLLGDDRARPWEPALWEALVVSLIVQGRLVEAVAEAEEAAVRQSLSPQQRARFAARTPLGRLLVTDWEGALEKGRQAEAQATAAGDVPAQVLSLVSQASGLVIRACWPDAAFKLTQAIALTEFDGTRASYAGMAHQTQAYVLAEMDDLDGSLAVSQSAQRSAGAVGIAEAMISAHFASGYAHFWSGRWEDALAAYEVGIALCEETGMVWQIDALALMAIISAWRGDLPAAWSLLERAEVRRNAGGPTFRIGWVGWARSVLEEAVGRIEPGVAALLPMWEQCTTMGIRSEYRVLGPQLAHLGAAAGRFELVAQVASHLEAQLAENPSVRSLRAAARRVRGLADQDGDVLFEALTLHRESPRLHDRARCAEEAAGVLARAGRVAEARAAAEEAFDVYAELSADGEVARARSVLRQGGLRFGSRGRRQRPVTGWAALTETEQRVARMAAERMTNPQIAEAMFISRRTVGSHISHLLAKLGMASRTELVAAGARRPLEQL